MATLVSPGVSITLDNQSFYAAAGGGTVPLVVIATAQDKFQPGSSTALASGTVKSNANKLYLVTSQREALQTFGVPKFYSVAGTSQSDNELNELGMYALYDYLGIANSAYVLRADIDLDQLSPTTTAPSGSPSNGDYWLDLNNTTYGVFKSNGSINSAYSWESNVPTVISDNADLEVVVQACVTEWDHTVDPYANLIRADGNLVINGVSFGLKEHDSLAAVNDMINGSAALRRMGISSTIFVRHSKFYSNGYPIDNRVYGDIFNLRLVSTNISEGIYLDDTTPAILEDLGFPSTTPDNVIAPRSDLGIDGDFAIDVISKSTEGMIMNQLWEKISVVTSMSSNGWWFKVGSTDEAYPGWGWRTANPKVIVGSATNPTFATNGNVVIGTGSVTNGMIENTIEVQVGSGNVQLEPTVSLDVFVTELNAAFNANSINASAMKVRSGNRSHLQIVNYDGTDTYFHDGYTDYNVEVASSNFAAAGIPTAQTFFGSVTGTTDLSDEANAFVSGDTIAINIGGGEVIVTLMSDTLDDAITNINGQADFASFVAAGMPIASKVTVGTAKYLKITNPNGTNFTLKDKDGYTFFRAGIPVGIVFGRKLVYKDYSPSLTVPSAAGDVAADNIWINTTPQNRGASYVLKQYANGVWTKLNTRPNTATIPMYRDHTSADRGFGASKSIGTVYMQYNSGNVTPVVADHTLYQWDGTAWVAFDYTPSMTAPVGPPAAGTLWYNTDLMVDIMVSNGQIWQGYLNMYPGTDPNGPILDASAPLTQSDNTPLVDYDIWINTSDIENYPQIYRYNQSTRTWILIDSTDHSSAAGIIFTDARATANGLKDGSTSSAAMAASDYVDSDAPNAELYPDGLLLFNTRYSTNNIKIWTPNALPNDDYTDRWVTASGNKSDGTPYMGHWAQRTMVVRALKATIESNQDVRAEQAFFNLIACPGYTETIVDMVKLNTDKKEIAFIIGDTPARLTPDGTSIERWASNSNNVASDGPDGLITHNNYVGIYYPWGKGTNIDGNSVFVPPSSMALRTYAYNDQVAYPWFAPAGFNRGMVTGMDSVGYLSSDSTYQPVQLSQGQRDVLYTNSVNPIAYIPNRGLVVYGQKTLSPTSSAMDRVNVARLINYLNYELDGLAKPYLFEPNDAQTREAVTTSFSSFMGNLVGLRALYDFAIVCDDSNNTAARIDRNELWIDIAIKPEKAIEFIYIPIRLLNTADPMPNSVRA